MLVNLTHELSGPYESCTWEQVFGSADQPTKSRYIALRYSSPSSKQSTQSVRLSGKAALHICAMWAITTLASPMKEEAVAKRTINIEGWHLILAFLAFIGGPYLYAWDSHKTLLAEVSGLRQDMRSDRISSEQDLKSLIAELKAERESDRQQSKVDNEAMQEGLTKIREAQATTTEALKYLKQ